IKIKIKEQKKKMKRNKKRNTEVWAGALARPKSRPGPDLHITKHEFSSFPTFSLSVPHSRTSQFAVAFGLRNEEGDIEECRKGGFELGPHVVGNIETTHILRIGTRRVVGQRWAPFSIQETQHHKVIVCTSVTVTYSVHRCLASLC